MVVNELIQFSFTINMQITDPGCSFWTFKSICERDFKLTSVITGQEMQHFFTSHIDKLTKRKREMVRSILDGMDVFWVIFKKIFILVHDSEIGMTQLVANL